MPGIGENRGSNQTLVNSYFYTRIFEAQREVKIALVIKHNDITWG
jgi:hypothetical protein